jgi:hypothetical protein
VSAVAFDTNVTPVRFSGSGLRKSESLRIAPPLALSAAPWASPAVSVMFLTFRVPVVWRRIRVVEPPLSVMSPPPSIVYTRFGFPVFWKTFWLVRVMLFGPPQLNVRRPPVAFTEATAEANAASVQLPEEPLPTTASARDNGGDASDRRKRKARALEFIRPPGSRRGPGPPHER